MTSRRALCAALLLLSAFAGPRRAAAQVVPDVLPLLPVSDGVLFPGVSNEIQILAPEHKVLVEDAVKTDSLIGLVTLRPDSPRAAQGRNEIFPVGVICVIDRVQRPADGRLYILVRAVMRFRVISEDLSRTYRMGKLDLLPETLTIDEQPTLRELRARVDELAKAVDPVVLSERGDENRINGLAFFMDFDLYERQSLLERDGVIERARAMIDLLTKKLANPR